MNRKKGKVDWFPFCGKGLLVLLGVTIVLLFLKGFPIGATLLMVPFFLILFLAGVRFLSGYYMRGQLAQLLSVHGNRMRVRDIESHYPQHGDLVKRTLERLEKENVIRIKKDRAELIPSHIGFGLTALMMKWTRQYFS